MLNNLMLQSIVKSCARMLWHTSAHFITWWGVSFSWEHLLSLLFFIRTSYSNKIKCRPRKTWGEGGGGLSPPPPAPRLRRPWDRSWGGSCDLGVPYSEGQIKPRFGLFSRGRIANTDNSKEKLNFFTGKINDEKFYGIRGQVASACHHDI